MLTDLSEEKKSSPGLASSRQLPMLSGQFLHDIKQNYRELATGHLGLPTTGGTSGLGEEGRAEEKQEGVRRGGWKSRAGDPC